MIYASEMHADMYNGLHHDQIMAYSSAKFATRVLAAAIAVPFATFTVTYILFYTVQDEARHRRDPKLVSPRAACDREKCSCCMLRRNSCCHRVNKKWCCLP